MQFYVLQYSLQLDSIGQVNYNITQLENHFLNKISFLLERLKNNSNYITFIVLIIGLFLINTFLHKLRRDNKIYYIKMSYIQNRISQRGGRQNFFV